VICRRERACRQQPVSGPRGSAAWRWWPRGIDVKVTPLDRIPNPYRELRRYDSDDEEGRYEITYRFDRVA
jgi:hypothetical protein